MGKFLVIAIIDEDNPVEGFFTKGDDLDGYRTIETTMRSWDGSAIFYRAFLPASGADRAVVLFHRGHEHSGRLTDLVERLQLPGFAYFAWDARGNGNSEGPRDAADAFSVYVKDADLFVRHISNEYAVPVRNMSAIANSLGGVTAAAWVHDYAPPIRALVLAAPAFRIKLYVPLAIPLLRFAMSMGMMKQITSYVKAGVLTHDEEERERFRRDEKITHAISTNILIDAHDTATRIIEDAGAIRTPTLLLTAGADWVVKKGAQRRFFERLSSPDKRLIEYPGFYHALFHEKDREAPIAATRDFILRQYREPVPLESLTDGDVKGYTKREYDRLRRGSCNPVYGLNRLMMKSVGKLSDGIRLGWKEGFDSGVTLDYVYRNRPHGRTFLGRIIDKSYLDSVGWRGIRQRRVHMENLLRSAIEDLHKEQRSAHIVDIASGPGRYVLNVIRALSPMEISATLRDYKEINIEEGRRIAAELELRNVRFECGDAFDRRAISALDPRPSIVIASGIYELFPDNQAVVNSLQGLASALLPGGFLLYTNQPWHPQVEFIARVLTNREGQPWIMRRRTQEEMDELARVAGFEKVGMEIDRWGIFTVSLARKRGD